jgi:hypothetical protein
MSKSIKGFQPPTSEEIAICAHSIYEKEGRPNGRATQHWLQAEAQLIAERKAQAGQSPVKAPEKSTNNIMPAPARDRQPSLHRN